MIVLIIGLVMYTLYSYLAYRYLSESQVDIITINYDKIYGYIWMENDSLIKQYTSEISKWSTRPLFSDSRIYSLAIPAFISLVVIEFVFFGYLTLIITSVIVFLCNFLTGILFKGTGIQYSILISFLLGITLMII